MTDRSRVTRAGLGMAAALLIGLHGGPGTVRAGEAVAPGALFVEPATPHALGFRWNIAGDANANAEVRLSFRESGATAWRRGPSLRRVSLESRQPERRPRRGVVMAGSLVGLSPGSGYQVMLSLEDPDGGGAQRRLELHTTTMPSPPEGLRPLRVTPFSAARPPGGAGTPTDPINGLQTAAERAAPGDRLLLAPGTYRPGRLALTRSGAPGRPIVIEGAGPGPATLDGGGAAVLLDLSGLHDVRVRGLVLTSTGTLILADRARDLVIEGNRFEVTRAGYVSKGAVGEESRGHLVTDNVFLGPTAWPRSKGIEHIFGIAVSGAGHVVAHNRLEDLGDCIRGAWVDGGGGLLSASEIFGNEIQACTDDGIEIDHADANVRVWHNRITNSFAAISFQPVFGGPVYVYRNLILNTLYSPFKLHNDTAGVIMIHNTSVRSGIAFHIRTSTETVRDSVTRNNLFVGTEAPALASTATMIGCDLDGDGYAPADGAFALWNGRSYRSAEEARESGALYARLGAHRLEAAGLFEATTGPPEDPGVRYPSAANRPLLRPGSPAVDRGVPLAGFNDGHAGAAPDLGCCELGAPLPDFGPRPPWPR